MLAPGIKYVVEESPKIDDDALRADIAGFAGVFERGPVLSRQRVEDWGDQRALFGGFVPLGEDGQKQAFGPLAMYGFFQNGGRTAIVVRFGARTMCSAWGVLPDPATGLLIGVSASSAGAWANGATLELPLRVRLRRSAPSFPAQVPGLNAGDVVRIAIGNATSFGRMIVSGAGPELVPWPIGPIPAGPDPIRVEVIEPRVDVVVRSRAGQERHRDLSLLWESPRFVWRVLALEPTLDLTPRSIPETWRPLDPASRLALSLAQQGPGLSAIVRTVLPDNYPKTWPPPPVLGPLPVLPAPWPAALAPATAARLRAPVMTLELGDGADGIEDIDPSAIREAIRLLAIDPAPSFLAIPDLLLPLAPDEAPCTREFPPHVPLPPAPPVEEPCPAAPLEGVPCDPATTRPSPPVIPPPLPPALPPPASGLPRYGDSVPLLMEELLFAISTDRNRNADPETGGDRIALIDPLPGRDPDRAIADADALRRSVDRVAAFGATHYPWLRILDPLHEGRNTILVPPSGHLAGIMARTTREGTPGSRSANIAIEGATSTERLLSERERALLNDAQLSALHQTPGRGVFAFGARTLSHEARPDRFLPASRVMAYVRRVARALGQTLVFEPNDAQLWMRVRLALDAVLHELFRKNALAGQTREEAYDVRCDEHTNPPEDRNAGRAVALIDVAPALPLEFITLRIAFSRDEAAIIEDFTKRGR